MDLTSALWRAAVEGEYDRINQLICSGANVNERRDTDFGHGVTLLHYATKERDVQLIRLFLYYGANCNACDCFKRTPLHYAVDIGEDCPDVVEVLINGGAIVDARNVYEFTPFLQAAQNHYCQSAELLIARGASIDAVSASGWNALHMAAMLGDTKDLTMIKMLIGLKININAEDSSGKTPLHLAIENINYDPNLIRFLLDNGADLNKKDNAGDSALRIAAYGICPTSVRVLLKRGACINEVDEDGYTALHVACMNGWGSAVALLVQFGADMNVPSCKGKTALQLWPPNSRFSKSDARIIIRKAVEREALGLPICQGYRKIAQSCTKYSKFDQECREEIKRMQSERIDVGDSAVSFFDILTKNEKKLAALARNNKIVTAFETSDYLAIFRIYAIDLTTKFKKAKRLANSLIGIEDCLDDAVGDILPALVLQKIAAHVEDDDVIEDELWNEFD